MQRIDLRGQRCSAQELTACLPRAQVSVADAAQLVAPVLAEVRSRGADALRDFAEKFDGVRPKHLRVPAGAMAAALANLDPQVRDGLTEAIRRVRAVHAAQRPAEFTVDLAPGAQVRQRWVPVRRVGLYAPGGLAVYPSSVVMNVVAAQEAQVAELAVASPPQAANGGLPHPTILAACELLGVREVYAVGGAQAVAMFAYGAHDGDQQLCEPVDIITGPGNVYVAAAKRLVLGVVGIDAEAGPTEIAVLADGTADPRNVAYDLISQAEHDPLAASVLITPSTTLADAVDAALDDLVPATKHAQRVADALGGSQSAIVVVDDLAQGLAVVNAYAAEHLEIQTVGAAQVAQQVTAAGAVFVGPYSPVPLGDYMAGSNHVLPTGGTARFASGLGVHTFMRAISVVEYDEPALADVADRIVALANDEDLPAHGDAIRARFA